MDTRFWGPSGWRLLHSITNSYPKYPSEYDIKTYQIFFLTLPHILPCIYCRNSLTEYYNRLPIDKSLEDDPKYPLINRDSLIRWLYQIHNLVNDKLRAQGIINFHNPTLEQVLEHYNKDSCKDGWDFLYAIALNYPQDSDLVTRCQRQNYLLFFNYLPKVIPDKELAQSLQNFTEKYPINNFLSSREPLSKWLYSLERLSTNCNSCFSKRCRQIERYRAGCKGKGDKKPTCRRIKSNKK